MREWPRLMLSTMLHKDTSRLGYNQRTNFDTMQTNGYRHLSMKADEFSDLCRKTAAKCKQCADLGLTLPDVRPYVSAIRATKDAAILLWVLEALFESSSPFLQAYCALLAQVCLKTAAECKLHQDDVFQTCAGLCGECAFRCEVLSRIES
jgi:hypothetical protein